VCRLVDLPAKFPRVIRWSSNKQPTETLIKGLLEAEGMTYYKWGNDPLDVYTAHSHPYNKIVYVVEGSITFGLPEEGRKFTLRAGDRLDLPAGTVHNAVVSTLGVTCLEAHWE
jgi:quercetin dioxygenase-like cupin family protein